jgi:hypothetical protein
MSSPVKFWQWPNLLAVDAALIAVVWQVALAQALGAPIDAASIWVLGLAVWLTYTADRLFDVAGRPGDALLSIRHSFTKRNALRLWVVWSAILFGTLLLALLGLSASELQKGTVLLCLCLVYLFLCQKLSSLFFPKEALVALIFTGGVLVFQRAVVPLPFALSLAVLVLLNCLIISAREAHIDDRLGTRSLAVLIAARWLGPLALGLHVVALLTLETGRLAFALAFLALGCLHLLRHRIDTETFRVIADSILLVAAVAWLLG